MRASRSCWVIAAVLALGVVPAWGQSQRVKGEILEKHRDAMASYDNFAFEDAKQLLEAAIAQADEHGLAWDPFLARVHLDLGVVYFSGLQDRTAAELQFIKAVEIDPYIELDPAYSAKDMAELLSEVKRRHGEGEAGDGAEGAEVDCDEIAGIEHTLVESAEAGVDRWIEAFVSGRLGADRVVLHYRPHGGEEDSPAFLAVVMEKQEGCKYVGRIPGHGVRGKVVHYYIAAHNKGGQVIAGRGSARAPNLMVVEPGTGADGENPLAPAGAPAGAEAPAAEPMGVLLGLGLGTGGGYISGSTEQTDTAIDCCFAPELLHLRLEGGYRIAPRTMLSLVLRAGFPLGANIMDHATVAPAGLVRLRHALEDGGRGLLLSAVVGGGVIRQTIRIENGVDGMDTDTAAIGPLLAGGGASYVHPLGGRLALAAGVELLLGLPVVSSLGTTKPQFGMQLDLDLGVQLVF